MDIFLVGYEFSGDDYYTDFIPIAAYTTHENAVKAMNECAHDIVNGKFDKALNKGDYEVVHVRDYQIVLYAKEKHNEARLTIQEIELID